MSGAESNPSGEVPQSGTGDTAGAAGQGQSGGASAAQLPPTLPNWAVERIDTVTRQMRDKERELELKNQELENLRKQLTPTPQAQATSQPILDEAEINRRAQLQAQTMAFNAECDAVVAKGTEAFPDFSQVIGAYRNLGGLTVPFMQALLAVDDPHEVVYELAKDLGKAQQIMTLPPTKAAAALTKFQTQLAAKKAPKPDAEDKTDAQAQPQVQAPAPLPARVGAGNGAAARVVRLDDDNVPVSDWIKARNKELSDRRRRA